MCPLVKELKSRKNFDTAVCVTGQHHQMLDQVLADFSVIPDYDLSLMRNNQTLFDITASVLQSVKEVLKEAKPDVVLVHGDTSSAFACALACFYMQIPVGHVEAGLRTYDIYSPYPEEFNRRAISIISRYDFAPTERARENLLTEGKDNSAIFLTGNTVIDALKTTVRRDYTHPELEWSKGSKLIFVTVHRRENLGNPMRRIFCALRRILEERSDIKVLYPIHLNPLIINTARRELAGCDRVHMTEPLGPLDCHNIMARSYMILTDSGGVQEEASFLGKPTLVLREKSERLEGIESGALRLVGTDESSLCKEMMRLLTDGAAYEAMAHTNNAYGNGCASKIIADVLEKL